MLASGITAALVLAGVSAGNSQTNFLQLRSFGFPGLSGIQPLARLIVGSDGALYGTTSRGGMAGEGTVYQFNPTNGNYLVLHHFTGGADGGQPYAALMENTNDGFLYGTTCGYITTDPGTVFKLDKSGSNYTVLHVFTGTNGDGANPRGELLQGSDGLLYGMTYAGGTSNLGTVFKLDTNGNNFAILTSFTGTNGSKPHGGLVEGTNGMLYGATFGGYRTTNTTSTNLNILTNNYSSVFAVSKDGTVFTQLLFLPITNNYGTHCCASLLLAGDGMLYGTMRDRGINNAGTIFKISQDGATFAVITNLTFTSGPEELQSRLLEGSDGALYGTSTGGGTNNTGAVFKINKNGKGLTVLHNFTNGPADGDSPQSGLAMTANGTLFGTTPAGGINDYGTIYSLGQDGSNFTVVHLFLPGGGDGLYPNCTAPATDNVIYGTTESGGSYDLGTVFKYEKATGNYAVLHSFAGGSNDGIYPLSVFRASDGQLYGTTSCSNSSAGTIFSLDTNGNNFAILKNLAGANNASIASGLVEGADGAFYGVAPTNGLTREGILFRLDKAGTNFTVLKYFTSTSPNTFNPRSGLLAASDGLLYGTAELGGGSGSTGAVFRIGIDGTGYTNLCAFSDGAATTDGNLHSALFEGSDGALYGTIDLSGTNNYGKIFKLQKDGSGYTVLYQFTGLNGDGSNPWAGLIQGADGAFYGTTKYGGLSNLATLFRLKNDGSNHGQLDTFNVTAAGDGPQAGLSRGDIGTLFGTTVGQGDMGFGSLFQITTPVITPLNITQIDPSGLLTLSGSTNQNYQIQVATNLVPPLVWQTITTNTVDATGKAQFLDPNAASYSNRFYRSVIP